MGKFSKVFDRFSIFIATCCFSGFIGRAPGTTGALLGAIAYPATFHRLGPLPFVLVYGALLLFSVWVCGRAAVTIGEKDPPSVIFDEFIAMPLCYWPLEQFFGQIPVAPWAFLLIGFALFRFFDISKPLAIWRIQSLPGGWGIVLDDTAAAVTAAISTAAILPICARFFPICF